MRIRFLNAMQYIPNDGCRAIDETQTCLYHKDKQCVWEISGQGCTVDLCIINGALKKPLIFICEKKKKKIKCVLAQKECEHVFTFFPHSSLHGSFTLYFPLATTHTIPILSPSNVSFSRLGMVLRSCIQGHCIVYDSFEVGSSSIV